MFGVTDIVEGSSQEALRKANIRLSQGAQRSAKVVEEGSFKPVRFDMLPKEVYRSKKDEGVLIQKPKFSIKSMAEVREIPYAGQRAQREKRRLRLL